MEPTKPRRIRDIAHLYLSRSERRAQDPLRVLAAASSRDAIPGFHIANLAVALSVKGWAVRVFELSALQPNAAFFLSLPPGIYLDGPDRESQQSYSALGGISVSFSLGSADATETCDGKPLDLVHMPPHEDTDAHRRARENASGDSSLTLRFDPTGNGDGVRWTVPDPDTGESLSGEILRWRPSLVDPVPVVIRDPRAVVSRTYFALSDGLKPPKVVRQTLGDGAPRFQRARRVVRRHPDASIRSR